MSRLATSARVWRTLALIVFNTLVLFAVANLVASVLRPRLASAPPGPATSYANAIAIQKVYPGLDGDQIDRLLLETWSRPFVYESYTQFKEAPFTGWYVNVDPQGFRRSEPPGPWPPDPRHYKVFLFGGSTTFGYGVPDAQTLGSHLQQTLADALRRDVRVYNFGRGSYISTQERVLFEQLLAAGHTPDLALFVDGLNEFYFADGEPCFAGLLDEVMSGAWARQHRHDWMRSLPVVALAGDWQRPPPEPVTHRNGREADHSPEEIRTRANAVCQRYLRGRQLTERIAAAFGARVAFAWQPVPLYKYDLNHHQLKGPNLSHHWLSRHGYKQMAERLQREPAGTNFLWCADLQESLHEPLYVDSVHYSGRMNGLLAREITARLAERRIVP